MTKSESVAIETHRTGELTESLHTIQSRLERLERREWRMWWSAVVVMLLLTTGIASFALPSLLRDPTGAFQLQMGQAVRALVGLVLLFNAYTIYQHILIRRLRGQLSQQMEKCALLECRAEDFYRMAVQDPLTGLYNRRCADERLATEVSRAQRHQQALTVMALDLNEFKQINDRHGHAAGDDVLKQFATQLKNTIRTTDMAARLGGDEFLVILPECPPERARILLNRLGAVDVTVNGRKQTMQLSTGWAGFQPGDTPAAILERADQALYENKRASKAAAAIPVAVNQ